MSRASRIAGSLAIVVIAYWAYALLAVPWIEPPTALAPVNGNSGGNQPPSGHDAVDVQVDSIKHFFKHGAWELRDPTILECDGAKLIIQTYDNSRGDGTVEIHPCTIVFPYQGPAENEAQRHRQTIILEAPDGAVLQFDQPLDIGRAKVGRLVGGRLKGKVTIRSDWKEPGPEDDLLITTSDVRLTEQTISTPNPVDFRWGPHFGRGRDMVIKLLAGTGKPGDLAGGPNIAGIESFELRHVERLHLNLAQASERGGKSDSPERSGGRCASIGPVRLFHRATCRWRSTARAPSSSTWSTAWRRFAIASTCSRPIRPALPTKSPANCSRYTSPSRPSESPIRRTLNKAAQIAGS